MVYDICFDVAALLVLAVVGIFAARRYRGLTKSGAIFRRMLLLLFFALVVDIVSSVIISYSRFVPVWLNMVLNAAGFLALDFSVYAYVLYMECLVAETSLSRKFHRLNQAFMALYVLAHLANIPGGFLFYFDEGLHYRRGPFYLVVYAMPIYFFLYGAFRVVWRRGQLEKRQFYAVMSLFPTIGVASVLQFDLLSNHLIILFGMTLAVMIIFFSLETPDYQQLKATVAQLQAARQEADDASRAKSDFLARMSHEIRTPINAILGMNEMILREAEEEAVQEYASNAYNAGQTLLGIISDILDISKIEAGKLDIVEADYELSSLINDCYIMVAHRAEKKGLDFTISIQDGLPSRLKGDVVRIRQIVLNFLTNAVKYTERGSVELRFERGQDKGTDAFLLRVSVADTGIGLTEESMGRLFTSFQRFDMKQNQSVEGTGLGLAISKQLAELMGGVVCVESEYGKGSVFTCTIPQQIVDAAPMAPFNPRHPVRQFLAQRRHFTAPDARILVVDDVEMNLAVFQSLLKGHEMQIDTAESGRRCLALTAAHKYDLIFMDHMMPEMDGVETLKRIRGTASPNRDTPVIMLTANAISGGQETYVQAGFSAYLTKPIQGEKLERAVLRYLPEEKILWEDAAGRVAEAETTNKTEGGVMKHILIVDDNKVNLSSAKSALNDVYKVTAVISGAQALRFLEKNICDLILLDINMPEMDGFEVMRKIRENPSRADIPVIFLTADSDAETEKRCLDEGAMDFIAKPFVAAVMRSRISRILELEELQHNLEGKVAEQTRHIRQIQDMMVLGMASLVESRDTGTGEHIRRTSLVMRIFAEKLQGRGEPFTRQFLDDVVRAAPMHDLGKIAVDDMILRKNGRFTDAEYAAMKKHAAEGAKVVKQILEGVEEEHFVKVAINVAHYHHEKWNGTGYPCGLSGEGIPLEARMMALADVFDALVSRRVYKDAFSYDKSFSIMEESIGSHFDPELGKVFMTCRIELERLYDSFE